MGDDAWRALRPRRLAVCAGSRGTARDPDDAKYRAEDAKKRAELALPPSVVGRLLWASAPSEKRRRIDRRRALANFKVQLRRRDVSGLPRARDDLTALDLIIALDQELAGMGVGGDIAVGMPHQHQV